MTEHIALSYEIPLPMATIIEQSHLREYIEKKEAFLEHTDLEIVELTEDRVVTRKQVAIEVPAFAKKFLSPTNLLTEVDVWAPATSDTTRHYTLEVTSKGVPATITGSVTFTVTGPNSTRVDIATQVDTSVPLIGGKLAEFIAKDLRKNVEGERDFSLQWAESLI